MVGGVPGNVNAIVAYLENAGADCLRDKLKLWDYKEVLTVHENLEYINESINKPNLVQDGF